MRMAPRAGAGAGAAAGTGGGGAEAAVFGAAAGDDIGPDLGAAEPGATEPSGVASFERAETGVDGSGGGGSAETLKSWKPLASMRMSDSGGLTSTGARSGSAI